MKKLFVLPLILGTICLSPVKGFSQQQQDYVKAEIQKFRKIPISQADRERIHKLISHLGFDSVYKLLWKKGEMEKLGDQVDHVHPLPFLECIFSQPHLKSAMRKVRGNGFKWYRFINGLSGKLNMLHSNHEVVPYLNGFAYALGKDPTVLRRYANSRDWSGMVGYLQQ